MMNAAKAASVLELMRSLTSSNSSSANSTGFGRESADPFDDIFSAMSGKSTPGSGLDLFPQMSPATINALVAAQTQSLIGALPSPAIGKTEIGKSEIGKPDVPKDPFSQLDANGDGQVSKLEFEANAAGAATSSYNVMNEMIARQMQAFATSSSAWMKF
ncbi:MAG: EF-hand domain-containing protein [Hyphomicrobiaceae bacterium]|nr:EF-hand domain-containing protein [Hyphomicrobiaceae bacterium]